MSETMQFGLKGPVGSLVGSVAGMLRWWGRELAACVPSALRDRLGGKPGTLIVSLRPDEVMLDFAKPGRTLSIGRLPLDPDRPEGARDAVRQSIAAARIGAAETFLLLPEQQVMRRPVDLPLAARENLREVLTFEMDRLTPFAADGVEFDARPGAGDLEAQTMTVDLAVVPRDLVDRSIAILRGWALVPDAVGYADGTDAPGLPGAFVFRRRDAGRGRLSRRIAAGLWMVVAALGLALVLVPLDRKQEQLAALEAELAERRTEAAAVDTLRRQVSEMAEVSDRLWREKGTRPASIVLLDEVTRLLPNDTWLLQIRMAEDRMTLSGYSAAASALVPVLEASELLSEVRFDAPVTLDGRIGLERFNISATIVGGPEDGS